MKRWIVGNWKMNGSLDMLDAYVPAFLDGLLDTEGWSAQMQVAICPPFPYLGTLASRLIGYPVGVGAQDVFPHPSGAYTGEVSPPMLKDLGVSYCIVGHSERRWHGAETDEQVRDKAAALLHEGIHAIVCVGESGEERESGRQEDVVIHQVSTALAGIPEEHLDLLALAYEPVWAIGTGVTASPEQAGEMHAHIRELLAGRFGEEAGAEIPILYGGSVNPDNAAPLTAVPEIGGILAGGASLKPEAFVSIIQQSLHG